MDIMEDSGSSTQSRAADARIRLSVFATLRGRVLHGSWPNTPPTSVPSPLGKNTIRLPLKAIRNASKSAAGVADVSARSAPQRVVVANAPNRRQARKVMPSGPGAELGECRTARSTYL